MIEDLGKHACKIVPTEAETSKLIRLRETSRTCTLRIFCTTARYGPKVDMQYQRRIQGVGFGTSGLPECGTQLNPCLKLVVVYLHLTQASIRSRKEKMSPQRTPDRLCRVLTAPFLFIDLNIYRKKKRQEQTCLLDGWCACAEFEKYTVICVMMETRKVAVGRSVEMQHHYRGKENFHGLARPSRNAQPHPPCTTSCYSSHRRKPQNNYFRIISVRIYFYR
jgi:hypothetical protein